MFPIEEGTTSSSSEARKKNVELDFIVSDIQSLKFEKKYDLVIASEVLLHILPSEIEHIMRKLVNMSNKYVINLDRYEDQIPKKIAAHNFIHQYERIYKNIPSVNMNYSDLKDPKVFLSSHSFIENLWIGKKIAIGEDIVLRITGTLHEVCDDNSAAWGPSQGFRDIAHNRKLQPGECRSLCISTSRRNNSSRRSGPH